MAALSSVHSCYDWSVKPEMPRAQIQEMYCCVFLSSVSAAH